MHVFQEVLEGFIKEKNKIAEANRNTSYKFNSLKFFSIGETKHSMLLGKLLDPNAEHGQGNLFLNIFLDHLGIEHKPNDKWVVTVEKGKIDILIKRYGSPGVIIIENKSNNAIDQDNQLYRYWLQEMFLPNSHKHHTYTLVEKKRFRLVYLTPDQSKSPCSSSLLKPNWDNLLVHNGLPDNIPINYVTCLTFNNHIVKWLQECLNNVTNNPRLHVHIQQYLELWQTEL